MKSLRKSNYSSNQNRVPLSQILLENMNLKEILNNQRQNPQNNQTQEDNTKYNQYWRSGAQFQRGNDIKHNITRTSYQNQRSKQLLALQGLKHIFNKLVFLNKCQAFTAMRSNLQRKNTAKLQSMLNCTLLFSKLDKVYRQQMTHTFYLIKYICIRQQFNDRTNQSSRLTLQNNNSNMTPPISFQRKQKIPIINLNQKDQKNRYQHQHSRQQHLYEIESILSPIEENNYTYSINATPSKLTQFHIMLQKLHSIHHRFSMQYAFGRIVNYSQQLKSVRIDKFKYNNNANHVNTTMLVRNLRFESTICDTKTKLALLQESDEPAQFNHQRPHNYKITEWLDSQRDIRLLNSAYSNQKLQCHAQQQQQKDNELQLQLQLQHVSDKNYGQEPILQISPVCTATANNNDKFRYKNDNANLNLNNQTEKHNLFKQRSMSIDARGLIDKDGMAAIAQQQYKLMNMRRWSNQFNSSLQNNQKCSLSENVQRMSSIVMKTQPNLAKNYQNVNEININVKIIDKLQQQNEQFRARSILKNDMKTQNKPTAIQAERQRKFNNLNARR